MSRATLDQDAQIEATTELKRRGDELDTSCDAQKRLLYLASVFIRFLPHDPLMGRIAAEVPADAEVWAEFPEVASQLAADPLLADDNYVVVLRAHRDVRVRQWATAGALRRAALADGQETQARLWDELRSMEPEEPELVEVVNAMSPERPLAPGALLPHVALVDFEGTPQPVGHRHQRRLRPRPRTSRDQRPYVPGELGEPASTSARGSHGGLGPPVSALPSSDRCDRTCRRRSPLR